MTESPVRLRDLRAPPWRVRLGERSFLLRPLSLSTFSEAEMSGVTLDRLSDKEDQQVWIELLALLNDQDPRDPSVLDELLPEILTDPLGFEQFRVAVGESFSGPQAPAPAPSGKAPRRKVQKFKPEVEPEVQVAQGANHMDYAFLLDISRMAGVSVGDVMNMTFYGLTCVSQSLKRAPPLPGGGMMGGL